MKIEGKVALVTGGASGIGKDLVGRLLERGIKFVAIVDNDENGGRETIGEFSEKFEGERLRFIRCDVTDEKQLRNAFDETYNVHGSLDVVVNNAGMVSRDQHLQTIKVNMIGVMYGMLVANEVMTRTKRAEKGVIINTSSVAGFRPDDHTPFSYIGSKYGVMGLTKAFTCSCDGFSQDLRCVAVCPGAVDTPISTRNGFMTEEERRQLPIDLVDFFMDVSRVTDGFIQAIEDDSLYAVYISVEKTATTVIRD